MMTLNKWYFIFFFVLSLLTIAFLNFLNNNSFKLETSVWCHNGLNQTKLCKFKNICYDSEFKSFLFFLGENTVTKGFAHYSELQKIQLSSVQGHNNFYANLSMIDSENYKLQKELRIYSKALLFSRFKPNNLMHSIHDDIFPVFLTLELECLGDVQCIENFFLMIHDNHPQGPFFYLYKLLSKHSLIVLNELKSESNFILCFKEMMTGLILDGIFYQYGFKKAHGPIIPSQLTQNDISRFTKFLINKLKINNAVSNTSELVLIKREKNRKILNVDEVKKFIEMEYKRLNKRVKVNVVNLNLYSNNLKALIKSISQADGLVGMHGGEMILSLFLKPKSFVIEIFPFGIKPEIVSFIKSLSEVEGSNFLYYSWKNMLKNNSVAHPNAHPMFGGISHLDEMTQNKIKNTQEVPGIECCTNPLFLYHMYQDTYVTSEFRNFFHNVLAQVYIADKETHKKMKKWFYPYTVSNVSCSFELHKNIIYISWSPPFNVQNKDDLWYSLYIKDQKNLFVKSVSTTKQILEVEVSDPTNAEFEMWISAHYTNNASESPDLYIKCK